jgi:hypothetical protein
MRSAALGLLPGLGRQVVFSDLLGGDADAPEAELDVGRKVLPKLALCTWRLAVGLSLLCARRADSRTTNIIINNYMDIGFFRSSRRVRTSFGRSLKAPISTCESTKPAAKCMAIPSTREIISGNPAPPT